jgi:hypothetical protein
MKKFYAFLFLIMAMYFVVNQRKNFEKFNTIESPKKSKSTVALNKEALKKKKVETYKQNLTTKFKGSQLGRFANACVGQDFFIKDDFYRDLKNFKITAKDISHWENHYFTDKGIDKVLRIELSENSAGEQVRLLKLFSLDSEGFPTPIAVSSDEATNPTKKTIDNYIGDNQVSLGRVYTLVKGDLELGVDELDSVIKEFKLTSSSGEYSCDLEILPKCRCIPIR